MARHLRVAPADSGFEPSWSAQQLAEFHAAISSHSDEAGVGRTAVELVTEAFAGEAAALVLHGAVIVSLGFPAGQTPSEDIVELTARRRGFLDVPEVGMCASVTVPLGQQSADALVIARAGGRFSGEELRTLDSMGYVLSLTLGRFREARASAQRRHDLLKQISAVQRSISNRAPLHEVLDTVTRGLAEVLGDEFVLLYGVDSDDEHTMSARSTYGSAPKIGRDLRIGEGAVGQAVVQDRPVVVQDYASSPLASPDVVKVGVRAAMAAPIHENGCVVGGLVVGSCQPARVYSVADQEILTIFAEAAGLAVAGAAAVDALQEAADGAHHLAQHDPLTGLANRARFVDRFEHALKVRRQPGAEISVLYLDIDDFKLINDRVGHAEGDRLLIEVGMRVLGAVRAGDTVARLDGDEFAVLLENASGVAEAERTAIRILEEVSKPIQLTEAEMSVTLSLGVAVASPDETDPQEVLRNSEVAMYRGKNAGKASFVIFEDAMYESLLDRLDLESDLRRAVENGDLEVYYQPIVDLASEQVVGVEALSRWQHPTRGFVPPATFIPLAEEAGLIGDLGRSVLEQACSWIGSWQQTRPDEPLFYVSVNISARQLQRPEFTGEVEAALVGGGARGSLVLEITESLLMQDTEATLARLHDLKSLGIRLALDDFGTGYSSLSYLRRFPIDMLKIDRSFVSGLRAGNEPLRLVEGIMALGNTLGLETVAEGVEELEELAALRSVGCGVGQGFYFARPMPVADLESYLSGAFSPA